VVKKNEDDSQKSVGRVGKIVDYCIWVVVYLPLSCETLYSSDGSDYSGENSPDAAIEVSSTIFRL
jgi:hypothetical protein